jgi:predicted RNA-binding protein with PUA domain
MISNLRLSEDTRQQLIANGMPKSVEMLVDAVDWLREDKNIHIEAILSGNHIGKNRDEEYIIRVSDNEGGNISKFSSKCYKECLTDGLEMALRIFF